MSTWPLVSKSCIVWEVRCDWWGHWNVSFHKIYLKLKRCGDESQWLPWNQNWTVSNLAQYGCGLIPSACQRFANSCELSVLYLFFNSKKKIISYNAITQQPLDYSGSFKTRRIALIQVKFSLQSPARWLSCRQLDFSEFKISATNNVFWVLGRMSLEIPFKLFEWHGEINVYTSKVAGQGSKQRNEFKQFDKCLNSGHWAEFIFWVAYFACG